MKVRKCETPYCRNKTDRKYCSTCRSRQSRQRNPVKYAYNNLKSNSIRRKKEFELTLDDFILFCNENDYIQGKGKTKASYSIDRKRNELGYTKDNIRILTLGENSRKGTKTLHYDYRTKSAIVTPNIVNDSVDNYF